MIKNTMRMLANCEFFSYEGDVYVRHSDGTAARVTEADTDLVREMEEKISNFYPEAYNVLQEIYRKSSGNVPYYRFRIVARFIRCNLAEMDHVPDVDTAGRLHLESVACPMRGECPYDGIICRPSFNHRLSPAELRVMKLLYDGYTDEEIADTLCLSRHTVHTHIRNSLTRLDLHSRGEFMKYAAENDLFPHGKV